MGITYSEEFKQEHHKGKLAREIFEEAECDVNVFGIKRVNGVLLFGGK